LAIEDCDRGALSGEAPRGGLADALATAGHNRHSTGESFG
jgi:hypothetical protein